MRASFGSQALENRQRLQNAFNQLQWTQEQIQALENSIYINGVQRAGCFKADLSVSNTDYN